MTNTTGNSNFWTLFGKLALILATLWVLTQLYNYFIKNEYKLDCKGNHINFELPPNTKATLNDYVNRISLEKAYSKYFKDGARIDSIHKIDNTLKKLKAKYSEENLPEYYYNLSRVRNEYSYFQSTYSNFQYSNYNSLWTYTISNQGNKPIEELVLELPYKGIYVLTTKNEPAKIGNFKNQIEIGNLKPTQEITIKAWAENQLYEVLDYDEEKTRLTHKYGWESIEYSKKAEGVLAWYLESYYSGMLLSMITILILFIIFFLGWQYGPKISENDRKIRLREFEELQKLSEEERKKRENATEIDRPPE